MFAVKKDLKNVAESTELNGIFEQFEFLFSMVFIDLLLLSLLISCFTDAVASNLSMFCS